MAIDESSLKNYLRYETTVYVVIWFVFKANSRTTNTRARRQLSTDTGIYEYEPTAD